MSLYTPDGTPPLLAGTSARVERRLPNPGDVTVRIGQRVEPDDIVARAFVPGRAQTINLARELAISPRRAARALRVAVGGSVTEGQVMATAGRVSGRSYRAPFAGVLTNSEAETGYVTLMADPDVFELRATVRGVVMEIMPYEGVRIETPAAQLYAAFGIGEACSGVLRLLTTDPAEPIRAEQIDSRSAYSILIGGSGISANGLRRAVAERVRGVIVGSMDAGELSAFLDSDPRDWQIRADGTLTIAAVAMPITIIITDGFGSAPMSRPIYDLLSSHDGAEALAEGTTRLVAPLQRPRIIIPLSTRNSNIPLEPPRPALRVGAHVRLLDADHLGTIGRVTQIPAMPRALRGSGIRAPAVNVSTEDGTALLLPQTSVEVLA